MPLNPAGIGATTEPRAVRWTAKDCPLNALGVGARPERTGVHDGQHARRAAPNAAHQARVLGVDMSVLKAAGEVDSVRVVHAEQGVDLLASPPVAGSGTATTRLVEVWDKGAAAVTTETELVTEDGTLLARSRSSLFIKRAGGWGGERGPSAGDSTPDGSPDATVTYATRDDQALLYRLSGDRNPLHSDPWFARRAGFDRPILHGLCTYGFTGRAVLQEAAGGDPDRVRSPSARFARPVYPGDVLHVDLWRTGDEVRFQTGTEAGTAVLSHGRATVRA